MLEHDNFNTSPVSSIQSRSEALDTQATSFHARTRYDKRIEGQMISHNVSELSSVLETLFLTYKGKLLSFDSLFHTAIKIEFNSSINLINPWTYFNMEFPAFYHIPSYTEFCVTFH